MFYTTTFYAKNYAGLNEPLSPKGIHPHSLGLLVTEFQLMSMPMPACDSKKFHSIRKLEQMTDLKKMSKLKPIKLYVKK